MDLVDYLVNVAGEEGAEVAQRASKIIRFGIDEVQPGQTKSNRERFFAEVLDLIAVVEMLQEAGQLPHFDSVPSVYHIAAKKAKVREFMKLSHAQGKLSYSEPSPQPKYVERS